MQTIGILALQGGTDAHAEVLGVLGYGVRRIRCAEDFSLVSGLVLPGGESTSQLRLIQRHELRHPIQQLFESGRPILATCAGLILVAEEVTQPKQECFGWMNLEIQRNAYGNQINSSIQRSDRTEGPLVFIRAPRIIRVANHVEVLDTWRGDPVLVRQGNVMGATFHPELTSDPSIHRLAFG